MSLYKFLQSLIKWHMSTEHYIQSMRNVLSEYLKCPKICNDIIPTVPTEPILGSILYTVQWHNHVIVF